ncbi:MAG: hypothetical protein ACE5NW_09420 [Acidiferrobacterales bacterium]
MTYSYPFSSVSADYARAGIGLLITGGPALLIPTAPTVLVILSLLALVFLGFGIQTALRHRTRIGVTDEDITVLPRGVRLRWNELTAMKLDYYSTDKESKDGWMQLTLKSGKKRLRLDSRLDGFVDVAGRAVASAKSKGLVIDPTSMTNIAALGIDTNGSSTNGRGVSDG